MQKNLKIPRIVNPAGLHSLEAFILITTQSAFSNCEACPVSHLLCGKGSIIPLPKASPSRLKHSTLRFRSVHGDRMEKLSGLQDSTVDCYGAISVIALIAYRLAYAPHAMS